MARPANLKWATIPVELQCTRCFKRQSCIECCGTRLCLRHFHTSFHSSEHPEKAVVNNEAVLQEQRPAFEKMWRDAFQSVAEDIERLTEEVGERVAKDPLATIGMQRPDRFLGSSFSGKGPTTPRDDHNGSAAAHRTKRQRRQEKLPKVAAGASASSAADPFERRRTRPTSSWSTHKAKIPEDLLLIDAKSAEEEANAQMGEYECQSCESRDTSFDVIGGAALGSRKEETFGKKDAPELVVRVLCRACGYTWVDER